MGNPGWCHDGFSLELHPDGSLAVDAYCEYGTVFPADTVRDLVNPTLLAALREPELHTRYLREIGGVEFQPEPHERLPDETLGPMERFRLANVARCEQAYRPLKSWGPMQWAAAMTGEAAEACNAATKLEQGKTLAESGLLKELGDVYSYMDLLAARCGISPFEVWRSVVEKFNEVSARKNSPILLKHEPTPHSALAEAECRILDLQQRLAEWTEAGQKISDADPAKLTTSPAHAVATAAGVQLANASLRARVAELEQELTKARSFARKAFALGLRWEANRCTPEDLEAARAELQRPEVRAHLQQLGIDPDGKAP